MPKPHAFPNKLLLNQWLMSLFGIDPLAENKERPFHLLAGPIKGFTFEYSATFQQAVRASGNADFKNSYAKTVFFDYSYRWFYEDGFGKDYKIDNLPHPTRETINGLVEKGNIKRASQLDHARDVAHVLMPYFLTACLLKFYQQLHPFLDPVSQIAMEKSAR